MRSHDLNVNEQNIYLQDNSNIVSQTRPTIFQVPTRPIISQMTGSTTAQVQPTIFQAPTRSIISQMTGSTTAQAQSINTIRTSQTQTSTSLTNPTSTTITPQVSQTQIRPVTFAASSRSTTAPITSSSIENSIDSYIRNSSSNTGEIDVTWYQVDDLQDSESTDQLRQNLLNSLRTKYNINESDTLRFHIEEEYYLEYLLNWGISATIADILKKPIIVIEE